MSRRTRFWAVSLPLVALALACLWYFASPLYTLRGMRDAAAAGDDAAFAAYVDFPALRADLKTKLSARIERGAADSRRGLGIFGSALGAAMVDPLVDTLVSPAGLRAAFAARREERLLAELSGVGEAGRALRLPKDPVIERRGLDAFAIVSRSHPDRGLLFARRGLRWKLSGVLLPPA